jgi:hypothetical protein
MNPARVVAGIVGAVVGGVVGALIWGGVIYFANYEIGFIAWGVGGLVGFCALFMGARGIGMGVICGLIAALSICGGKVAGFQFMAANYSNSAEYRADLRKLYDQYTVDAHALGAVNDERSLREYMVEHKYAESLDPNQISEEDMTFFREETTPFLTEWAASPPPFEDWFAEESAYFRAYHRQNALSWDNLKASVSMFDILFFFLGVSTAFQLVASKQE